MIEILSDFWGFDSFVKKALSDPGSIILRLRRPKGFNMEFERNQERFLGEREKGHVENIFKEELEKELLYKIKIIEAEREDSIDPEVIKWLGDEGRAGYWKYTRKHGKTIK
ncbi:hypothetical protein ILUMI_21368 [Ignelater luminosus]|uniref:Uncharacterized protein n=1 Tax=Ignelater luminosus TaxID=2038154 RepID=A0A8K0CGG0_IGNLU|nr:hypothetical protein ILUMI_21368 [Ignelater luminosus]